MFFMLPFFVYHNAMPCKLSDWLLARVCIGRQTPAHELVFAKQRGFCYWPAKVLQITGDGFYDIRFFGGNHNR